jgi:GTP-binding protein
MKIALIGRPNVGKSTLFNRLIRQRSAIVGEIPGITRDRKSMITDLYGLEFELIDTPGVDPASQNVLAISMNEQSLCAIRECNLVFFIIDVMDGVTEYDKIIASWIRSSFKKVGNRNILLIKNKAEGRKEVYNSEILGFGEGVSISAEHNLGINNIYDELLKYNCKDVFQKSEDKHIKIAIVGRPNVGKSTLINAIIEEDRLLTGEQAGITRDAISIKWTFKNRKFMLIDTAGQRRQSKAQGKIEYVSIMDAWKHIRLSNIVVVVVDIQNPFEKQDLLIAQKAYDEGKTVIFAINKSDIVGNPQEILKSIEERAVKEFAQLPGVACLLVSAKEKKGLARIFNVAIKLFDKCHEKIPTHVLNKWLQAVVTHKAPSLIKKLPVRLKYISQTNTNPPTFTIFSNRVEGFQKSYERYLLNNLRKSFGFEGVPLRIFIKRSSTEQRLY